MLTVLLATHNGASVLPRTMEAFKEMSAPPGGHLIVVVDNASTDGTDNILQRLSVDVPLKIVRTERRGKNYALNIGLEHVEGDLIVFTDDDVLPCPDWLCHLDQAARENPSFDLFGGRIVPNWPGPCPPWINEIVNLGATYGITPTGIETGAVKAERIWGANMAVRRRVFDLGYRFNEAVGPASGQYIMGSETEFCQRLEDAGFRAWFVADAVVEHIIRENQMKPDWIIQRAYRLGRGWFLQERPLFTKETKMLFGIPRWKYREWTEHWLMLLRGKLRGDFNSIFRARWELSLMRGYFDEAARQRKTSQAPN